MSEDSKRPPNFASSLTSNSNMKNSETQNNLSRDPSTSASCSFVNSPPPEKTSSIRMTHTQFKNNRENLPYIDDVYKREYTMSSWIFDCFWETETTATSSYFYDLTDIVHTLKSSPITNPSIDQSTTTETHQTTDLSEESDDGDTDSDESDTDKQSEDDLRDSDTDDDVTGKRPKFM